MLGSEHKAQLSCLRPHTRLSACSLPHQLASRSFGRCLDCGADEGGARDTATQRQQTYRSVAYSRVAQEEDPAPLKPASVSEGQPPAGFGVATAHTLAASAHLLSGNTHQAVQHGVL